MASFAVDPIKSYMAISFCYLPEMMAWHLFHFVKDTDAQAQDGQPTVEMTVVIYLIMLPGVMWRSSEEQREC